MSGPRMVQFLNPEAELILPFQEIVKMDQQFFGPRNCRNDQQILYADSFRKKSILQLRCYYRPYNTDSSLLQENSHPTFES